MLERVGADIAKAPTLIWANANLGSEARRYSRKYGLCKYSEHSEKKSNAYNKINLEANSKK